MRRTGTGTEVDRVIVVVDCWVPAELVLGQ